MEVSNQVDLKFKNFFSDFFYKPLSSKLSGKDKVIASIATVALAVFSLGFAHLVLGLIAIVRFGIRNTSKLPKEGEGLQSNASNTAKLGTENVLRRRHDSKNVIGEKNQYQVGPESACTCHAIQAACTLMDKEFSHINGETIDQILLDGAQLFGYCGFNAGENYSVSALSDVNGIPEGYRLLNDRDMPCIFEVGFRIIEGAISCSSTKNNLIRALNLARDRVSQTNEPVSLVITEGFTTTTILLNSNDDILHFDSHGDENSGNKAFVRLYSSMDDFASEFADKSGHAPQFDIFMLQKS